eukprot:1158059-Pelagomonas_calceolata.AAC.1
MCTLDDVLHAYCNQKDLARHCLGQSVTAQQSSSSIDLCYGYGYMINIIHTQSHCHQMHQQRAGIPRWLVEDWVVIVFPPLA